MGLLRLFLALSVIAGHAQTTVFGVNGIGAWYAVNFFFIISGFYMAMVLNGQYKTVSNYQFYKSRVLRLFPAYYVGLALCFVVYYSSISYFFGTLTPLSKILYVFQNAFIVGQDISHVFCVENINGVCANSGALTINPPAWSLAVELGFYLVAPFILRNKAKTFGFVLVGAVYLFSLSFIDFPFSGAGLIAPSEMHAFSYYFYPSSFAFFGGGALAYHLSKSDAEPNYYYAVAALLILSFAQTTMPFWHLLFFAMAIPVLFKYTANNKIDRLIGELSYPVYIVHFPLLIWLRDVLSLSSDDFGFLSLGSVVSLLSIAVGLVVYYVIERKVSSFRHSKAFFESETPAKKTLHHKVSRWAFYAYIVLPVVIVPFVISKQIDERTPSDIPYELTDSNWQSGVSRTAAEFFIRANSANKNSYRVGVHLKIGNSGVRKIIKVEQNGEFLNIHLDGTTLATDASSSRNIVIVKS